MDVEELSEHQKETRQNDGTKKSKFKKYSESKNVGSHDELDSPQKLTSGVLFEIENIMDDINKKNANVKSGQSHYDSNQFFSPGSIQ